MTVRSPLRVVWTTSCERNLVDLTQCKHTFGCGEPSDVAKEHEFSQLTLALKILSLKL